jgi:hypothetical protein
MGIGAKLLGEYDALIEDSTKVGTTRSGARVGEVPMRLTDSLEEKL